MTLWRLSLDDDSEECEDPDDGDDTDGDGDDEDDNEDNAGAEGDNQGANENNDDSDDAAMDPEQPKKLDGILFKKAMDLNGQAGSTRLQACLKRYIRLKENENKMKVWRLDPPSEEPPNVVDSELDIQPNAFPLDATPNMHSHLHQLSTTCQVFRGLARIIFLTTTLPMNQIQCFATMNLLRNNSPTILPS